MKQLLAILLLVVSLNTFGQSTITNNATFRLNGFKWSWLKATGTDSVATLYDDATAKFFGPLIFGRFNTVQMNALENRAGTFIYNTDSLKVAFNDGSQWVFVGGTPGAVYSAGNGLGLTSGLFKLGGTPLSENTTVDNAATYTLRFGNGSTKYFQMTAAGNACINCTTTGGYDLNINGIFSGTSSGYSWSFNGSQVTFVHASAEVVQRMVGFNKRWDLRAGNGRFTINPVTANDSLLIEDNNQSVIFKIRTDNKTTYLNHLKISSAPFSLLGHNTDSSVVGVKVVPVTMGGVPAGGMPGYALRKVSGADYDVEWSAITSSGDLTGSPVKVGFHVVSDADYTVAANDCIILYSNQTTSRTLTLPSASTNANRVLKIKNGGAGAFNINLSVSVRENTAVTFSSVSQGLGIIIISDGTDWWKVGDL